MNCAWKNSHFTFPFAAKLPSHRLPIGCILTMLLAGTFEFFSWSADVPTLELVVLPPHTVLAHPRLTQRFIVEAKANGQFVGEWTAKATFTSSNPKVAKVSKEGVVFPVSNGRATITARIGNRTAKATVIVKIPNPKSQILKTRITNHESQITSVWSFRNHVLPVLTKAGCNSGACHGAAAGKGGLKLTLRGYDPMQDYFTITRQVLGRRVNKLEPAKSLMLLKPTLTIEHGGGQRFAVGSLEYKVIAEWIACGCPPPRDDDPTMTQLEVFPSEVTLKVGDPSTGSGQVTQQILVRAHFSDGHMEDVTRWAKFSTTDSSVAVVDEDGKVTVMGSGECAITIWYLNKVTFATITAPFANKVMPVSDKIESERGEAQ